MNDDRNRHWEGVYDARRHTEVSWYQPQPARSLDMIARAGVAPGDPIIDIGGGASTLVDHLLDRGHTDLTVLDISDAALAQARARLGERAQQVTWEVADATRFEPQRTYRLWHDRAALHFLVSAADRERYVQALRSALVPGGHLILATFGPDGPLQCSGLEVRRYSVAMMAELLGSDFELQENELEQHTTPAGGSQEFLYARWRRCA